MNILILGSGGREHAFAWKIAQSPLCEKLFVAPGNAGTAAIATNLAVGFNDFEKIAEQVLENQIELVIVGPEEPLVRGVRDYFQSRPDLQHVLMVGPDSKGAMLEGSKDFSKNFMVKYGIPTAKSQTFTKDTLEDGLAYLAIQKLPIVLKADGLAAGKGVIIAETRAEAEAAIDDMFGGGFGAGDGRGLSAVHGRGLVHAGASAGATGGGGCSGLADAGALWLFGGRAGFGGGSGGRKRGV